MLSVFYLWEGSSTSVVGDYLIHLWKITLSTFFNNNTVLAKIEWPQ